MERGLSLTKEIEGIVKDEVTNDAEIILCPPFVTLASMTRLLQGNSRIQVGAQNCHQKERGAYTGSINCEMIKDTGATYVNRWTFRTKTICPMKEMDYWLKRLT